MKKTTKPTAAARRITNEVIQIQELSSELVMKTASASDYFESGSL